MRGVAVGIVGCAVALAACGGELPERPPATIEGFAPRAGQTYYCAFSATDADGLDYVFATLFDDPGNRARMSYGGEELKLVPVDAPPAFDGTQQDVLYAVENYPFYDVRLVMEPTGAERERTTYSGRVELRDITTPSAPEVVASREFTGGCGV